MKNKTPINVFDVADYILKNNRSAITHMKLHKLIYYAQAKHLVTYKKSLIGEMIQAWKFGPVFPDLYPIFKEFSYQFIRRKTKKGDISKIKGSYQKTIDYIMANYGHLNRQQLSDRTHRETPWVDAIEKSEYIQINNEIIRKFYRYQNKLQKPGIKYEK